ncbi:hypothetical protein LFL97_32280 [Burkholderia sp. JSH-S8]|nr:hypothetical protein LFL97_32280 [Burkholderia sp. JSH-S8]
MKVWNYVAIVARRCIRAYLNMINEIYREWISHECARREREGVRLSPGILVSREKKNDV